MRIKITDDKPVKGSNTGMDLIIMQPNEVYDVSIPLAEALIEAGLAEPEDKVKAKAVEKAPENKAVEAAPENKTKAKKKKTKKKKD